MTNIPQTDRLQLDPLCRSPLSGSLTHVAPEWLTFLNAPPVQAALERIDAMLHTRLEHGALIYPATPFRALHALTPATVKVVIVGQDPYHGPGQAQGLAFSVPDGFKRPPSLRNILQEVERNYPTDQTELVLTSSLLKNDLSRWVDQGVLLLNSSLTVEQGQPASHARSGWETVTDALIQGVAQDPAAKVFLLWGAHAQAKQALIAEHPRHLILMANHPSPLSAHRGPVPFMGCHHFQLANAWLAQHKRPPIDWKA